MTEIYIHVTDTALSKIKGPFDNLELKEDIRDMEGIPPYWNIKRNMAGMNELYAISAINFGSAGLASHIFKGINKWM